MSADKKPTPEEIMRFLAAVHRVLVSLARLHSRAEELLDQVNCRSENVLKALSKLGMRTPPSLQPKHPPAFPANDEQTRVLQAQAQQGAISVRIVTQSNGAAFAQIDGRALVPLPPRLVDLLEILIGDDDASNDTLVCWKSVAEIAADMKKRTGKQFNPHAITALIYRLKQQFTKHGENSFLIHQNRRGDYRFALRRSKEPVTDRDHR